MEWNCVQRKPLREAGIKPANHAGASAGQSEGLSEDCTGCTSVIAYHYPV